jgi:hypothetical protein
MVEVKNPYEVRVVSFRKKRRFVAVDQPLEVINKVTGEVTSATPLVGNSSYRDTSPFVKLYDVRILTRLRLNEVKVFAYVMQEVDYSGVFTLDIDGCSAWTMLHPNTVYVAIRRLCELDVIRKDTRGRYWLNPNIACKGSRDGMNLVFDDETSSSLQ